MNLIILFGPPASGKLTIGKRLSRLTGFPLLHNHLTNDLLEHFFQFGSKEFSRLNRIFRLELLRSMHRAGLPGLIMTYVMSLDDSNNPPLTKERLRLVRRLGGRSLFVELSCHPETLLKRIRHRSRRVYKKITSPALLRRLLIKNKMNTNGDFPFRAPYLRIDTDRVKPNQAAEQIVRRFRLPRIRAH